MHLFWGILVARVKCVKMGDHRRKNFSINNSVEALIWLKEAYQGLVKLHVYLGGSNVEKNGILFEAKK